jgi:pimeloyl-ACP methyl ester carboxylesterase
MLLPTTRYARSDDVHVAYQVFGAGGDLVFVPGFVSHIDNHWDEPRFARWLERLGSFARVVMFDKRGTGLSSRVPNLPTMDECMDDLRAVMDAEGIERAAIFGVSEGGSLASLFAAHHPHRCEALILYGAFARFSSWIATDEDFDAFLEYVGTRWGTGESLPSFAPSFSDDPVLQGWWGKFERLGGDPKATAELMVMNRKIDITDILPTIQVPTLVIHRRDDVLVDHEGGRTLADRIPDARLVTLDGTDHLPFVGEDALASWRRSRSS